MAELVDIGIVLVLGGLFGWLSQRVHCPNAVTQVVLGVVLGSALLGWVDHGPLLHRLGEIGVILLLGVAGLELGVKRLRAAGWAGVRVALLGIVLSVIVGYAAGWLYGSPAPESIYIGLAMAATSIGISVQLLQQFGLISHRVAEVVIAAAVLDDVLALFLLAITHGILSDGLDVVGMLGFAVLAVTSLIGLYGATRFLTSALVRMHVLSTAFVQSVWCLAVIFLGAFVSHALGYSAVVGAFFAGVGLGEGLGDSRRDQNVTSLQPMMLITMPFFFVMIGVQAQWSILTESRTLWLVIALIVFGVASKAVGGWLGVSRTSSSSERWLTAFSMVSRGEVGLVIATLGFEQGHLTQPVFVSLVFVTIVLSVLGPLLMAPFAKQLSHNSVAQIRPQLQKTNYGEHK